jgi:hypothetical protein
MTNTRTRFLLIVLLLLVTASALQAQVSITTLGPAGEYTQNFDGLGTAPAFLLTDNTSITGVYAFRQTLNTVPNVFTTNNGSSATGEFKNYGTIGAADRALGSLSSGTPDNLSYGLRFVNNTGSAIASLQITYTGEQWRNSAAAAQTLAFDYRQAATVTDLTTGTYTSVPALNFTSPITGGAAGLLDGNVAANRTVVTASFLVAIPVGQEVMIRWTDIDDAMADHGFGIDDLSVVARAAPTAASATLSGRVAMANGRGIGKAYVTLSGGNLTSPLRVVTNQFGYYIFPDLAVGQTYVLSVNSKLFRFTQPSRTISLIQDAAAIDFIAEP